MKAGKKLLITLLSAACVTAGALGITACNKDKDPVSDGEIYAVYQTYVAYAEAQGDNVLSYEEWLASIRGDAGAKGDKGDKGDAGEAGAAGEGGCGGVIGATSAVVAALAILGGAGLVLRKKKED